jgi:hypothetical protein
MSKEFKGTKGEWELKPNQCYNEIVSKNNTYKKNSTIFRVSTIIHKVSHEGEISTCNFSEEDNANAKLIAATPDLLEALQDLLRYCEDNDVLANTDLAKSAISKALD